MVSKSISAGDIPE